MTIQTPQELATRKTNLDKMTADLAADMAESFAADPWAFLPSPVPAAPVAPPEPIAAPKPRGRPRKAAEPVQAPEPPTPPVPPVRLIAPLPDPTSTGNPPVAAAGTTDAVDEF